jgi:AraC-like DNA-binding protein
MSSIASRIFDVPVALRKDVECFILTEFPGKDGVTIHTLPSAIPGIVFHHNDGRPAIEGILTSSGRIISPPTLFVHGAGAESSTMNFGKGSYSVIQVILKPHSLQSILGINAMILKDSVVDFNEFSNGDLNEQLINAHSGLERVVIFTDFLMRQFNQVKMRDRLIEESLHLIHRSLGKISIKTLLRHLNISERQFERRFGQAVGLPPMAYMRVKRFNEVMRLMKSGQYRTLTEVAYALHFHDQSHFIRDIKTFTGITPKSLSQKVSDFSHNQAGYSYT